MKKIIQLGMLLCFFGCSDNIKELEARIEEQAKRNGFEISASEVTKNAIYLDAWGKNDFYQEEIDEFLEQDITNYPKNIEVLFTGSSSIRLWDSLEEDMKPLRVLNRGFGGAHISHVNFHFEDIVKRYYPEAIVFFCGTNDVTALKTPKETVNDFEIFREKVRNNLPNVHIFVIGIKPSPARVYLEKEEMEYNKLISNMADEDELLTFIDIWDEMLTEDGERIAELFVEDGLHINEKGFKTWTKQHGFKKINKKKLKIVAIDYGIKTNILRYFSNFSCEVIVVPCKTSAEDILKLKPSGIFLSNGPGDPAATGKYAVKIIKDLIKEKLPVFGICLGHQLLALAMGGKTKKMKLGHRGANHPVKNLIDNKVEITSQNHGFEVTENNLPKDIVITHKSLFDNSIEGIKLKDKPVFSVQYHPESNPGPQDSKYLFNNFIIEVKKYAKKKRY